jgi:hypothetical protein
MDAFSEIFELLVVHRAAKNLFFCFSAPPRQDERECSGKAQRGAAWFWDDGRDPEADEVMLDLRIELPGRKACRP